MKKSYVEILLGLFVIVVGIIFVVQVFSIGGSATSYKYKDMNVKFVSSTGLVVGGDVKISGVKVGTVSKIDLSNDYYANVIISIRDDVSLPIDTVAELKTLGLTGGSFVNIKIGESLIMNKTNSIIKTKELETLEDVIGKLIFLSND